MLRKTSLLLLLVAAAHAVPAVSGGESPQSVSKVKGRIINSLPAALGEFPGMLSLQKNGHHMCGASILNEYWALTVASCVYDIHREDVLELLAGTTRLDKRGTRHTVIWIAIHPEFNVTDSWVNDIAVLRVRTPFPLNGETVSPIQLPEQGQDTPAGSPVTEVGWASVVHNGIIPNTLQKEDFEVSDQELCSSLYTKEFLSPIYPTQICAAGVNGRGSSCNGDSGGPLVHDGVVVGLVSWSYKCATPPYPIVYTRVSRYVDWINEQVNLGHSIPQILWPHYQQGVVVSATDSRFSEMTRIKFLYYLLQLIRKIADENDPLNSRDFFYLTNALRTFKTHFPNAYETKTKK